jgi:hypothetical protein
MNFSLEDVLKLIEQRNVAMQRPTAGAGPADEH